MPIGKTKLLAPILYPGNIYCAGANYKDNVAEMDRAQGREPGPKASASSRTGSGISALTPNY